MEFTVSGWDFVTLAVVIAGAAFVGWAKGKFGNFQNALRAMKAWMKVKMSWLRMKLFGGK